jgi:methionyl-tRNA formyltransferase
MKLRVVFAGTPAFALPPLVGLHGAHQVVGVMTQPDRPAGRGRQLKASPVGEWARAQSLPLLQPAKLRGAQSQLLEVLARLREWQADVIVVVAYGLILPREILLLPRLGCLNIHASLLPRWRGAAPIQRAIEAGDASTGVSIMQMDEALDTGPVLAESVVPIARDDTASALHDRLAAAGAPLLIEVLEALANGTSRALPQPAEGVTHAAKLGRSESRMDWNQDAVVLDRRIRAFNPWPLAETQLTGETVKLLMSRVAEGGGEAAGSPGSILGLHNGALQVACGRGVLEVLTLQRAGRKAIAAREFLNAMRGVGSAAKFE